MKLSQYIKTLYAILWNLIAFLCSIISLSNITKKKTPSFSLLVYAYNILTMTYKDLNELINNILSKQKHNNTAATTAVTNPIYKNKNSVSNRVKSNNILINQALKSANLLSTLRLKDAPATQMLISKQHFVRLQDKCAFLYPFCKQKSLQLINLLIFTSTHN